jgi:hypothetical protein
MAMDSSLAKFEHLTLARSVVREAVVFIDAKSSMLLDTHPLNG